MLATWLGAELAGAGLHVLETFGWKTRQTRPGFDPQGVVCHDTVTPPGMTRDAEQKILIDGRPDLAGPLAQLGVHRDGFVSVIAAGRCNHNGYGQWGNDAFGIEVFCYGGQPGHIEPWNTIQRATVAQVCAVLCRHMGWTQAKVLGHKETDPGRKIDPFNTDMTAQRAATGALLDPPEDDLTPEQAAQLEALHDAWLVDSTPLLPFFDTHVVQPTVAGVLAGLPAGAVDTDALAAAVADELAKRLAT